MKENRDYREEKIAALEAARKALPMELQNAICWAIENYSTLEEMGKASNMTLEEIQCSMQNAQAEKNYATLVLLYITKSVKESKENEES